jgi:hypothetical protein
MKSRYSAAGESQTGLLQGLDLPGLAGLALDTLGFADGFVRWVWQSLAL